MRITRSTKAGTEMSIGATAVLDTEESFYEQLEATLNRVPRSNVQVVLGDFNAEVGREAVFFPTMTPRDIQR